MKIQQLSIDQAFASLHSSPLGLGESEAKRRLQEFGPNRIEKVKGESTFIRFLKEFTHFFAIILWIAATLAFIAEAQQPGEGMLVLGIAIIGVILMNGAFSFWQEYRAEKTIHALQKLIPSEVKIIRGGRALMIKAELLVPGDVILLQGGDQIPADCRITEAFSVRVNNSTITGESQPHFRDEQPHPEGDYIESRNILLTGTWMVSGEAKALIFSTGSHTLFGKIAHLTQTVKEPLSPLQKEISRLSRFIAILAFIIGLIFFIIGQVIGLGFWANFIFAIGIIVANVPEGLLPTVSLALALGSQRMAKRHALIRHLPAVETLGSTTVICTDKTGTLTLNRMSAKRAFLSNHFVPLDQLNSTLVQNNHHFFEIARYCQTLNMGSEGKWMGDSLEIALVELAQRTGLAFPEAPRINELPFDAQRQRLSTVHQTPKGIILYLKGAPEVVLNICHSIEIDGKILEKTPELENLWTKAHDELADQGYKVLALAYRPLETKDLIEEDLILTGLIGLEDPPRPEVPAAIQKCKDAGIKIIMVTGDHPHTAKAIAREIGLTSETPTVITGPNLSHFSDTQLQLALDKPEILFARLSADQKMRIVEILKRKGEVVAVTGDGVNDAPALKKADIGIAMGICGSDVSREAADIILLDDNFASIVAAIEEGRAVFANIRKFLTYILTSNVPELIPYLAFVLLKIPLPLTIIQILAVDLGTDMFPALALGAEKPDPKLMQIPPRSIKERLITGALISRAYLFLGVLQAIAALAAFFFVLSLGGWHYGQELSSKDHLYLQATTACLSAIVVMQIVNVFLCRSPRASIFRMNPFENSLIWWGVLIEVAIIILIDYTPWGNHIFGTSPIPLKVWLFIIPFALGMLIFEELRKLLMRSLPKAS